MVGTEPWSTSGVTDEGLDVNDVSSMNRVA